MGARTGQYVGNYRLLQRLGEGGFAEVYLGEHQYFKSYAALKFLKVSLSSEMTRQFLFEGQTLVRLSHRNIVRALDFSMDRGHPVLITEYLSGGSLRDQHEHGACLSLEQVIQYVRQIAEALQYAHNHHVIHRDVKPENILIDTDQQLCLSDFGLALFAPSTAELSMQHPGGTASYMAPEQVRGRPTFASDQYALAIMAYEWLCGKRPFTGSQYEVMSAQMYVEPQPLREICPELPEEVEWVVLRALAKDPALRYVSVRAFAQALESASLEHIHGYAVTDLRLHAVLPSEEAASASEPPLQRKVFVAAADEDKAFVQHLRGDLRRRAVDFASEVDEPLQQEGAVREAIRAAYLVCLVASPHMRRSRQVQEYLRIALLYRRRLLLLWASGENIAVSLLDLSGRTRPVDVVDVRGERYEAALDEIVDCLREDTGVTPIVAPSLASLTEEPRNPYKGLRAFTRDDACDFFGRDALIQRALGILESMLDGKRPVQQRQRLLSIVGPSGSGKSSLVMAGLLPKLQRGAQEGSENWCYLDVLLPGRHPCDALLAILAGQLPKERLNDVRKVLLLEQGYGLYQLVTYLSGPSQRRIVLYIDQFEELFAPGVSEAERLHFLKLLLYAVSEPKSPLLVILSLRADFYDRPMRYAMLARLIEANQLNVLPMDQQEQRAAIELPAHQGDVQLLFEGDLVSDLLYELQGQPNALPLLEFTLEQLFQRRQEHWLTQEAYRSIGGLRGALARHAEDTYIQLPSDQERRMARTLFLRLIDPGRSEQDTTRRRAAVGELLLESDEETLVLSTVAHIFIEARLLTSTVIAGITSIEVSHEALIREWPRLATWLHEAREDILLQHTIATDAANWLKHDKAEERLYRGVQLEEALRWAQRQIANVQELAFIQASQQEQQRQQNEERSRWQRELALKRQAVQRLSAFLVTVSILLVISVVAVPLFSYFSNQVANNNRTIAQKTLELKRSSLAAQALNLSNAAETNTSLNKLDLALLLADAATHKVNDISTRNSLLNALEANTRLVKMVHRPSVVMHMLAVDRSTQLLVYSDGLIVTIDRGATQENLPVLGKDIAVGAISLSPDAALLAISNREGVWLWDMQRNRLFSQLEGALKNIPAQQSTLTSLRFSADGKNLFSARCALYLGTGDAIQCAEIQISSWNVKNGQRIAPLQSIQGLFDVSRFVVSPDGKYLATSTGETMQLWDVLTGQLAALPLINASPIQKLAFSPDGAWLALGMKNHSIQLWNTASQTKGMLLTGPSDTITDLAFSPDNQTMAASSIDGTVKLWEVGSGSLLTSLNGDAQAKGSLAFSADGKTLCSGSLNGNILFWNYKTYNPLSRELLVTTIPIRSPLLSPDGTQIFFGTQDGKIGVFPLQANAQPTFLDTSDLPLQNQQQNSFLSIHSLSLARNGEILAAGRLDGTISIWDVKSENRLYSFIHPHVLALGLEHIQLSSDGSLLLSYSTDGSVMLWDVARQTSLVQFTHVQDGIVQPPAAALSPDGRWLVLARCGPSTDDASCAQKSLYFWNIRQHAFSKYVLGPFLQISDLAFSSNGQLLAAITDEDVGNGIHLWTLSREGPAQSKFITLPASVGVRQSDYTQLVFSDDSQTLVSYTPDSSVFSFVLWNVSTGSLSMFAEPIQFAGAGQGDMSLSFHGDQLVSTHLMQNEGHLLLWNMSLASWQGTACEMAQRNFDLSEWTEYTTRDATLRVLCTQFSA